MTLKSTITLPIYGGCQRLLRPKRTEPAYSIASTGGTPATAFRAALTVGQCQQIRYEISEMPLTLYVCHCTECQTQSTSGFGMSMPTPKSGFRLIHGSPKIWSRKSHSGREVHCAFCSECGTRVYHMPTRNKSIINVKPGTLDHKKMFEPVGNLWLKSVQPWVYILPEAINFQQQPESFESLYIAWKNCYEQNSLT